MDKVYPYTCMIFLVNFKYSKADRPQQISTFKFNHANNRSTFNDQTGKL